MGEALPTAGLPRAFAHADLRSTTAWRTRIEAAERLVRNGAIPGSVLLAAYTEQTPAASGGVWDRAKAIQDFDAAIAAADPAAVAATLPPHGTRCATSGPRCLRPPLCRRPLRARPDEDAEALAFRIALLSPPTNKLRSTERRFVGGSLLIAIARGNLSGIASPDPRAQGIIAGFTGTLSPNLWPRLSATGRSARRSCAPSQDWTRASPATPWRSPMRFPRSASSALKASPAARRSNSCSSITQLTSMRPGPADQPMTHWLSAFLEAQAAEHDAARNTRLA